MAIVQGLCGFAVRQLAEGACSTVGISGGGEAIVGFLAQRFTDHSKKLTDALECANERAWKALEIALAGDSFWDRCEVVLSSSDDKEFGRQVRAFLDVNPRSADGAGFRDQCLRELRTARNKRLLTGGGLDPKALAEQAGAFARFADPQAVLAAEWQAVDRMAQELRQAGLPRLGQLLSAKPPQRMPLLVVAVRYFFRRQVETDPQLYQGLAFAQLERIGQGQDAGFAALDAALTQQGQRLDALLGEIQSVVVETHGAVLDLRDQIEGQSEQVRQIGQAVQKLLEQHQLQRRELRPGDSLSIRNDNERQLVKQVVARYRALPEGDRKEVPSLLNAIGKLEVVAGNFEAAQRDFQAVALLERDDKAQAEAHHNAYLASLEKRDWPGAIQELVKTVKLDAKRFAPFPAGKYQPVRILGAGGFGVVFLRKHRYMDAQVVVKTLALEDLGRDADKVFTEAQVLRQLEHPAIIRISECGYVDAARKSRPYILMDYFQGATLEEYVKKNGPLAVDDLIAVARQVADGLQAAHAKGILHRDVKPANLLVHKDAQGWKVKVIDFGLALRQKVIQKSTSASTARQSKTLIGESIAGTVDYAAPEQMGRRERIAPGPDSDVFGWAKTCCYAAFQTTQPLMKHWQSVPTPLAELLEKCLDEDPTKRPQGFADVLAALDNRTANPVGATSPTRPVQNRQSPAERATGRTIPVSRKQLRTKAKSVVGLPDGPLEALPICDDRCLAGDCRHVLLLGLGTSFGHLVRDRPSETRGSGGIPLTRRDNGSFGSFLVSTLRVGTHARTLRVPKRTEDAPATHGRYRTFETAYPDFDGVDAGEPCRENNPGTGEAVQGAAEPSGEKRRRGDFRKDVPMSHPLTVELSDATYAALQLRAHAAAQSPAAAAAAALEQHFGAPDGLGVSERPATEAEKKAARERFERHFGEVNLGRATGADNDGIDADLARAYADDIHEEG